MFFFVLATASCYTISGKSIDRRCLMDTLESLLAFSFEDIPFLVAVLAIAFTAHEFAHAYVAYKFGDPTAKNQGRLTLNPLSHVDPFGVLLFLFAGFGWAKPVPVNRFYFKKPRLAGVLVSLVGPLSNLLIAYIGLVLFNLFEEPIYNYEALLVFFSMLISFNLILFIFNLLPIPPLDGYRIIEDLVPNRIRVKMTQFEPYGIFIFLILVITPLDQYTLSPIFDTVLPWLNHVLNVLASPFAG
jgi:Zn-dependent protease